MSTYKAIIFDMDGTLFDTETLSRKAWMAVGKQFQLPVSEEFILALIGLTVKNAQVIFDAYMPSGWPQESAIEFHKQYMMKEGIQHGVPTKGDLTTLFNELKNRGYRIALATSSRQENMLFNLRNANIEHYFEVMLSAEYVEKGKPDPDIYLKTMKAMNVSPEQCLIVEDSYNGVRAASASKGDVVMIPDLVKPNAEIKSLCTYIVDNLECILNIV